MASISPPPLTIVKPGQGLAIDPLPGSIGVDFKLWGGDTGGAVSIVEHPFPVGALVLPHLHTREDEYSIVTEGEIGFRSGDREVVLGAGGYITKPRNEMRLPLDVGAGNLQRSDVGPSSCTALGCPASRRLPTSLLPATFWHARRTGRVVALCHTHVESGKPRAGMNCYLSPVGRTPVRRSSGRIDRSVRAVIRRRLTQQRRLE